MTTIDPEFHQDIQLLQPGNRFSIIINTVPSVSQNQLDQGENLDTLDIDDTNVETYRINMLPNFIIAGAAKAGTTSLWYYLEEHPKICMASIKEPCFFSTAVGCASNPDGKSPRTSGQYSRGITWYESLYQNCNGAIAVGEASTQYMSEPESPELIKKFIPNAKIIFLLRDPVERIYSHYLHERHRGWDVIKFEEMVKQQHPAFLTYKYVSSYQLHLKKYEEVFPHKQLMVYLNDDMQKKPKSFIQQLYSELGVNPDFTPSNLGRRFNPARSPRLPVYQRLLEKAAHFQTKYLLLRNNVLLSKLGQWLVSMNSIEIPEYQMRLDLRRQLIEDMDEGD